MLGEVVGSYRIVSLLGQGGMGVVYLAEHPLLKKRAVVKQLLPELSQNAQIVQRFFNEARAATLIQHPGIVDVFDFGYHASGSAYIVMEFLDGETLSKRLEKQRPQPAEAVALFGRQIARAVGAAHAAGIVHRDLKPDNVYLVAESDAPQGIRVKVLDFGIAKLVNDRDAGVKTRAGSVMGTPMYMSPEQCHGAVDLDYRTDIYALGCILFELIAGRPPFPLDGLGEILSAHMHTPAPSPRDQNPLCPPGLDELIRQMLAKPPEARPASMEVVAQRLEMLVFTPAVGGVAPTIPLPPRTVAPTAGELVEQAAPPRPPQTTLGGAAGQAASTVGTAPRSRVPWLVGGGAATVAAIAVVIGVASRGGSSTSAAAGAKPSSGAAGALCIAGQSPACADVGVDKLRGPARDAEVARHAFEIGCAADETAACGHLARMMLVGEGGPATPGEALRRAETACAHQDPSGCVAVATAKQFALGGTSQDLVQARTAATTACDHGDGTGCAIAASLALLAGDHADAAARTTAGIAALEAPCAALDDAACVQLAGLISSHDVHDFARAAKLLDASCIRHDPDACVDLGHAYQIGRGVPPEPERGTQLIREIAHCAGGRGDACAEQAVELAHDFSRKRKPPALVEPLTSACDAGHGAACASLAAMRASGETGEPDAHAAAQLYRTAVTDLELRCRGGHALDCMRAVQVLDDHAPDPTRATQLAHVGCDLGDLDACVAWSKLEPAAGAGARARPIAETDCKAGDLSACMAEGRILFASGAVADRSAAVALFEDACTQKLEVGCYVATYTLAVGVGKPADRLGARARFAALCEAHDADACGAAANLYFEAKLGADAARVADLGCELGDLDSCKALAQLATDDASRKRALDRACVIGDSQACAPAAP